MEIQELSVDNPAYEQVRQIREEFLYKPLGKSIQEEDPAGEADNLIFAAIDHKEDVLGCILLQRINTSTTKLRQVVVAKSHQGKGLGGKLVKHAEILIQNKGGKKIFLHSPIIVKDFYEKLGYKTTGEEYIESGLPHITMEKSLLR